MMPSARSFGRGPSAPSVVHGPSYTDVTKQGAVRQAGNMQYQSQTGSTVSPIREDGSIDWKAAAKGAAGAGAAALCTSYGAGAAAAGCAYLGGEIGGAIYDGVISIGESVVDVFTGSDDPPPAPTESQANAAVAAWFIANRRSYVENLLALRGIVIMSLEVVEAWATRRGLVPEHPSLGVLGQGLVELAKKGWALPNGSSTEMLRRPIYMPDRWNTSDLMEYVVGKDVFTTRWDQAPLQEQVAVAEDVIDNLPNARQLPGYGVNRASPDQKPAKFGFEVFNSSTKGIYVTEGQCDAQCGVEVKVPKYFDDFARAEWPFQGYLREAYLDRLARVIEPPEFNPNPDVVRAIQEREAEEAEAARARRRWGLGLGAIAVATVGWIGWRTYKRQPVVPPKVRTALRL